MARDGDAISQSSLVCEVEYLLGIGLLSRGRERMRTVLMTGASRIVSVGAVSGMGALMHLERSFGKMLRCVFRRGHATRGVTESANRPNIGTPGTP